MRPEPQAGFDMELDFHKLQSLGNDFVLLDLREVPLTPPPEALLRLADRRLGAGCDQLLLLYPPARPDADVDCRIYNADGSEAEQCGNGLRCVALYLLRHGAGARDITVRVPAGKTVLTPLDDEQFRANMGIPELAAKDSRGRLQLAGQTLEFTALSLGNPHAILRVDAVHEVELEPIASAMQSHPLFPQGVNVGVVQPHSTTRADLRVYERGAGETRACGSGACAAVVAGRYNGWSGAAVAITMPGGVLQVEWDGVGCPVWLSGPAHYVYTGRVKL